LVAYLVLALLLGRRAQPGRPEPPVAPVEPVEPAEVATSSRPPWLRGDALLVDVLLLVGGVIMLVWGSDRLVAGATSIATSLGVSSLVIGLTVVAIGTSMPELATSIVATRRGERDLAIGNVVGSSIFNIGLVLGLPAVIGPGGGIPIPDAAIAFDIPFMVAVALVLLPVAFHGSSIDRWEGVLFLAIYVAYLTYLVLAGAEHDALDQFTGVMWSFVVPLLALTLVGLVVTELRRRGRELS
jgi:cation:H+ antiporter